jgi:hypothetical protein
MKYVFIFHFQKYQKKDTNKKENKNIRNVFNNAHSSHCTVER